MTQKTPKTIGILGIGNMGSGIALNLIKHGFEVIGHDPDPIRAKALTQMGGHHFDHPSQVGEKADTVFIMVMRASEAEQALFGEDGLCKTLAAGSTVIITATFHPPEVVSIAQKLSAQGMYVVDSPVSGGYPGAQGGTLTLMPAAPDGVLKTISPVLDAISATIHHVGQEAGMGQTVKACLQSLLGSIFSATFEATVLAAKAGVDAHTIHKVFSTSSGGSPLVSGALEKIIDGEFEGGGSHIATMYKDLTISTDMARALGVPLFTASMAMQLFQAGMTRHPDGDNWVITRILEDVAGAQLRK